MIEPTVQELRYVVAAAGRRHFSKAAADCFVSQPTLSAQIRKLEERLELKLFERNNKQVRVTPAGESFVAQSRVALDELDRLEDLAASFRDPLSGTLHVGVISTLSPYLLPWLIPALRRQQPGLQLGIQEGKTAGLLDELRERKLDAMLAADPLDDPTLSVTPLFDEPFWLLCPEGHRLSSRKQVRDTDLDPAELLLLDEGHCLRDQALDVCGSSSSDDAEFRATSLETLQELVLAGAGCTLIPAMALRRHHRGASAIPFRSRKAHRRIVIACRRTFPRLEAVEAVASVIRGNLPAEARGIR